MDMDQVQRKDINNLMNDSLSKELDIHIGEYDEESKEYTFNINPFNYATVECNNWIMDFDELSKSYVPSGDSIIFLFNDKVKLSELSLKHISKVVFSFTAENCIVESIGFGGSVIDFTEVNGEGDVSVSLDLSKYSVNELVKLFSDDLFSIVVVLSNDLNKSDSVLNDWNLQFIFKDLLLDEKEATKNRIEEFTESTYLKKEEIIDTGWLDLPLTNDFLPYNDTSYKPMYRCIGGLVFIKGAVKPKTELKPTSFNDFYVISNLPSNCRLNGEVTTFVKHGSGYNLFSLEIRSSNLGFGRYATGGTLTTSIPNTAWININCCYCIDDIVLGMINNIIESVGDYNTLNNKPSINGQTLIGDTSLFIPNRTSELINDNDFITSTYHDNTKVDKITGKGLSTNDYTNNDKNKLASLENYDDTDVKSDIQDLESNKANKTDLNYLKIYNNSAGNNGYERIARLTVNGYYVDYPVEFVIKRRVDKLNTKLTVRLNGTNDYDPSISSFYTEGGFNNAYLYKSSTYNNSTGDKTVYDLYVRKGSAWDVIGLIRYNNIVNNLKISLDYDFISSAKTGWTQSNWLYSNGKSKMAYSDDNGNVIHTTYATKNEVSDKADKSDTYTKTETDSAISNHHDNTKVDKISGKGLSTNDYTNNDKNKLASLENYDDTDVWVTLQELEINKQNTLVSGSNIKTINNQSLLGSGNITIQGGGGGTTDYNDLDNKPSINDEPLIGNRELMDYDIKDTTQIYGEDLWQNDINANLYDEIQSLKNNKEDKITKKTTSGTYFTAYKQLDIVSVYMNRSNYSPTKNTWVTLGNLAEGFRPLQDIYMEYQDFRIRIQTGGAIQVYTANTPITILFNITYIN